MDFSGFSGLHQDGYVMLSRLAAASRTGLLAAKLEFASQPFDDEHECIDTELSES